MFRPVLAASPSFAFRLKDEQVRDRGVALLILEAVEAGGIDPIAIGFVRLQFHFNDASPVISVVSGLADALWR